MTVQRVYQCTVCIGKIFGTLHAACYKQADRFTEGPLSVIPLYNGMHILYSQKYWRELNLASEPKIAIARILADLNLAVRYRIAIHIYASRKFWRILIWRL